MASFVISRLGTFENGLIMVWVICMIWFVYHTYGTSGWDKAGYVFMDILVIGLPILGWVIGKSMAAKNMFRPRGMTQYARPPMYGRGDGVELNFD